MTIQNYLGPDNMQLLSSINFHYEFADQYNFRFAWFESVDQAAIIVQSPIVMNPVMPASPENGYTTDGINVETIFSGYQYAAYNFLVVPIGINGVFGISANSELTGNDVITLAEFNRRTGRTSSTVPKRLHPYQFADMGLEYVHLPVQDNYKYCYRFNDARSVLSFFGLPGPESMGYAPELDTLFSKLYPFDIRYTLNGVNKPCDYYWGSFQLEDYMAAYIPIGLRIKDTTVADIGVSMLWLPPTDNKNPYICFKPFSLVCPSKVARQWTSTQANPYNQYIIPFTYWSVVKT